MSYSLELTKPARDDLSGLEIWLQEEVLDELDRFAENPLPPRRRLGDFVLDFVRHQFHAVFYVFVTARLDEKNRVLRVKSIGLFIRRGQAGDSH